MSEVVINTRVLSAPTTGVQRYTREILSRLPGKLVPVSPKRFAHGIMGHLWEQIVLPQRILRKPLFSPSNTGPLAVSRQVVVIHDIAPLDHPEWYNPRFSAFYSYLLPRLARNVKKVITDSEFTRNRILEKMDVSPDKIKVVPLGVDSKFKPIAPVEVQDVIKQLGIPTRYYILSLGSLEPRKNLNRLLASWKEIESAIPDEIWLVLAGAKGRAQVFNRLSLDSLPPRVHFTGHVPDELLPALLGGALVFAYVSVYEGFGLPPLEAMASGTPVLAGNRASLPEVVGDAGMLVDPFDIESIASGLKELIDSRDLRSKLSLLGLQRAKLFSWEKTAQATWEQISDAFKC